MEKILILGGGCFWGMQDLFRKQPGVIDTEVGYCGGTEETARYDFVKTGQTDHAEALKVVYNSETNLDQLLDFFFKIHDPTTKDQQGNDKGRQYRSIIFTDIPEQAKQAIERAQPNWQNPIITEISEPMPFYPAEAVHQDYLERIPHGYTCHWVRNFD